MKSKIHEHSKRRLEIVTKSTILLLILVVSATSVTAQPGTLDNTFSGDGKFTTAMTLGNNVANAVVVQPDSKILVAGSAVNGASGNDFGLARYNTDGSADLTFNATGKAFADFNNAFNHCTGMVLQPDNKIVLGGYTDNGNGFDFALARFNTNGTLDGTFGNGGKTTAHFGSSGFGNAIALQPDGKILMTGYAQGPTANLLVVARFLDNGAPDESFGVGGNVMVQVGDDAAIANAIALQANDGKIVVGGQVMNGAMLRWESLVCRFNPNGTPDLDFGVQGQTIVSGATKDYTVTAVALQQDGKIITAGFTGNSPSTNKTTLARYLPNGSPDVGFAENGVRIAALGPLSNQPKSLVLQDDKIIVGGSLRQDGSDRFVLAAFNEDGSFATSFGNNGITTTAFGLQDGINAMAIDPDGKIVAAGVSFLGAVSQFAVARYHTETSLSTNENPITSDALAVYPNPLDESSRLRFTLSETEKVTVVLYDSLGRKIRNIIEAQTKNGGAHEVAFDASDLQAGVYFLNFSTPKASKTVRLLK